MAVMALSLPCQSLSQYWTPSVARIGPLSPCTYTGAQAMRGVRGERSAVRATGTETGRRRDTGGNVRRRGEGLLTGVLVAT